MKSPANQHRFVPFTEVLIEDQFWSPRIKTNRNETLLEEYRQCQTRINAFRLNWQPGQDHKPHEYWDSDVAKWIEAACYSLALYPDASLQALLDEVIDLVISAQQPDGYLNSFYSSVCPEKRWTNLRDKHELYCAGHLIEAAVAHFQTTGQRHFLDAMCRYADYIDEVFGNGPEQIPGYDGHEEIELALVKLYRVTHREKYLRLAKFFINERGKKPYFFDEETIKRGETPKYENSQRYIHYQAHLPVREQEKVVGHAVRAMYLFAAMTDLATELGDDSLMNACHRVWDNLTLKNLYITGGIGSSRHNEGFTFDYDLPNETAYAETCASVGLVFWAQRMAQYRCDRRYTDIMERVLYNSALSGVSLDGKRFFYENPLASLGQHHRQAWFNTSCCPPNLARLLASLGGYIYSQSTSEVAVHLYIQSQATFTIHGQNVSLRQQTNYPWDGDITFTLETDQPTEFALLLRIPEWCRHAQCNGEAIDIENGLVDGYLRLQRCWETRTALTLELSMPSQRMYSHPAVRQNEAHVALQRGPLVYCVEEADNPLPPYLMALPKSTLLHDQFEENLLGGIVTLTAEAKAFDGEVWENGLYSHRTKPTITTSLKAIPYCLWDNRSPGQMRVWLPET